MLKDISGKWVHCGKVVRIIALSNGVVSGLIALRKVMRIVALSNGVVRFGW